MKKDIRIYKCKWCTNCRLPKVSKEIHNYYISQSIWRQLHFKFLINHKRSSKEEAISMKDRLGIYD